jgi:hypothetical protein
MAWTYEIRDANDKFVESGGGFSTQAAAQAAGSAEAARLVKSGNMPPGGGVGTVTTGQNSDDPWQ